jgi:hypothetical protein
MRAEVEGPCKVKKGGYSYAICERLYEDFKKPDPTEKWR